ncbi:MAG TPA: hypothetical protein PLU80_04435, partial [Acidobacteriota bacterium]|nr:hypothetical protein [Acidobacteriota bacterium]
MRFDPALLLELARTLAQELSQAARGHCLRVDFLNQEDAFELCHQLRQQLKSGDMSAYVLDSASVGHELVILPERAIEIRNRKELRLCLIIPSGVVDAAASSLTNSFAAFDLTKFFKQTTETLVGKLPDDFKELYRQLKQTFRIALRPAPEHWADFVSALQQATSPAEAGCELWRLGLIPDAGPAIEDIVNRLERNLRSVQELARPARAQASPEERLEKLHLKPGTVSTKLLSFFKGRRLRNSRGWLQELSQPAGRGILTFDQWVFEQTGLTDLEAITLEPFLDRDGKICSWTGLQQPGGPGTQPTIGIGPKSKVTVKWTCSPQTPSNLKNWQVEVIPSREEFSEEALAAETISTKVSAKTRRASIKLDFDPETYPARVVQIRVTGLDEHGNPLAGADSRIIEGISTEFWFDEEAVQSPLAETRQKRDAVQTLPFGRLKVLAELKIEALHEAPGQWEADETYFSITLNGQRNCRVEISPVLRKIEHRTIQHPEEGGCYTAHLDLAETLDAGRLLTPVDLSPLWQTDLGATLLSRRKELFRLLQKQESRGLIETADWTSDLSERARSYAKAYREVLTQCDTPEILWLALRLDTIFLEINNNQETETAVLVQPTHPMRVVWYAAYVDLLGHWEKELGKLKIPRERQRQIDLALIERVTPLNWPAFVLNPGGEIYLFAQNLHFFWALALPVGIPDPGRQAAQIARMVGFQEDEASLSDLPPKRIAAELNAYLGVHPYLKKLRVNAINPGSGGFLAEALREFYAVDQNEQAAEADLPASRPHLE